MKKSLIAVEIKSPVRAAPVKNESPSPNSSDSSENAGKIRLQRSGLLTSLSKRSESNHFDDDQDGFDVDSLLKKQQSLDAKRRQTKRSLQTRVEDDSEWKELADSHKISTPVKQGAGASGLDEKENSPFVNSGLKLFSLLSPSAAASAAKKKLASSAAASTSGTPSKMVSTPLKQSAKPTPVKQHTPLRQSVEALPSKMTPDSQRLTRSCTRATTKATPIVSRVDQLKQKQRKSAESTPSKQTPTTRKMAMRNRTANEMKRLRDDASDSDSDDCVEVDGDRSEVDSDSELEDAKPITHEARMKKSGNSFKNYFQDVHDASLLKTSDNTLEQLPDLSYDEYQSLLTRLPVKHAEEKAYLREVLLSRDFHQWHFELDCGFNLLFYGYGSKRRLLNELLECKKQDHHTVIVNGYFPTLNYRAILSSILSEIIEHSGAQGSVSNQTELIYEHYRQEDAEPLYLLVHNIDASPLRSDKIQASLARLASAPKIHLIASIDHINSLCLWDSRASVQLNWLAHDLSTFEPYVAETADETYNTWVSKFLRSESGGGVAGLGISIRAAVNVLSTLTRNAREIFMILARHQIQVEQDADDQVPGETERQSDDDDDEGFGENEEIDSENEESRPVKKTVKSKKKQNRQNSQFASRGLSKKQLYDLARAKFVVGSSANLDTQLVEFRDHQLMLSQLANDGTEVLFIPFSSDSLETIFDELGL